MSLFGNIAFLTLAFSFVCHASDLFESKIRAILAAKCQSCHNTKVKMSGLDLTSAEGFRKGTDKGPVVDPANPDSSALLRALRYDSGVKMPPTGKLPDSDIRMFQEWISNGAEWPEHTTKTVPRGDDPLWAFEPVRRPAVPAVQDSKWVRQPIDSFLLAAMEAQGLRPAPVADPLTLLRRVTYDLTGLPPTGDELLDFLRDPSDAAYERVVERLLSSPRYGERWGRHWLDVARYADSTGADEDVRYPYAWRYRDYVIRAFQDDAPYDRFIRAQLAGEGEDLVATGFLAVGPKLLAEIDKRKMFYDIVDEQIETTGKAFLGLTIHCARCHDHKFDPISTKDYYSLARIFASTRQLGELRPAMSAVSEIYFPPMLPPTDARRYEQHMTKVKDVKRRLADIQQQAGEFYIETLLDKLPKYLLATVGGSTDGLDPAILAIWRNYLKPGKERLPHMEPWLADPSAATAARYLREFRETFASRRAALTEWRKNGSSADSRPFFFTGENRFYTEVVGAKGAFEPPKEGWTKYLPKEDVARLEKGRAELARLEKEAPPAPEFVSGIVDGDPVAQHVFVRGDPGSPGPEVRRAVPAVLAKSGQPDFAEGSGRRELAAWISDPRNPLTARVFVNRVWSWRFGAGLVRTPSNFGVMGERPTHPELLDYLASEFVAKGWSIKQLHRMMLLSAAYRMSSELTAEKAEKDADNRLLTRFHRRRMDVEEIRDSLLMLEGKIDLTMGGTLQKDSAKEKSTMSYSRLGLNPDESYRRTVYLPIRRSNVPAMFTLFDFGDAATSSDGRSRTNIAPQALFSINSEFVTRAAGGWAGRLLASVTDDKARVRQAWLEALGREPSDADIREAMRYLDAFPGDADPQRKWRSYCRALLASNLFVYIP